MGGKYITEKDRYQIEAYLKSGLTYDEIAEKVGKSSRTIRREIQRGTILLSDTHLRDYYAYCPDHAQLKYEEKKLNKGSRAKIYQDPELHEYIARKILDEKYSPEAVLAEIKREKKQFKINVCIRTIYSYIDKGILRGVKPSDLPVKKNEPLENPENSPNEFGMINDFVLNNDPKK